MSFLYFLIVLIMASILFTFSLLWLSGKIMRIYDNLVAAQRASLTHHYYARGFGAGVFGLGILLLFFASVLGVKLPSVWGTMVMFQGMTAGLGGLSLYFFFEWIAFHDDKEIIRLQNETQR